MATDQDTGGTTAATRAADEKDATSDHTADRAPTPEEAEAAETQSVDPSTAEAYQDMARKGAQVEGEGRI